MCNKASAKASEPQGLHRGKTFRELRTYLKSCEWVCGDDVKGHPEIKVECEVSVDQSMTESAEKAKMGVKGRTLEAAAHLSHPWT